MAEDNYENKNAGELRDILKSITGELSRQRTIQAESAAEYRKMDSIAKQLQDTNMGISNLSSEELQKLKERNQNHIKELQYQAERLARQKIGLGFEGKITAETVERLKYLDKLTVQEEAILRAAADHFEIEKSLTAEVENQYKKRLAFEKQVSNSLGVSGAVIGGIDKVMDKLGINSGIFKDHINQSKKAMQDAAETAAKNGEHISRTSVMMKGLVPLAKGFGKALLDPLTILTAILDGFFNVNKASVELQRLTGQNETAMAGMSDRLASSVQFLETAAELTKQLGLSATSVFSPDQIAQLAEAKNLLGFSAEQAGKMGTLMKLTGKSVDQVGQGVYDTVNAYNGANRAAINQRMVLEDVLSTSSSITASFSGNEKQLGKAATQAAALGINLQRVDEIAGSLLNFEDSIGAELEAQLMTGKNINLSRARELALNNDLEGVAKELKKNGASAAEFANMNRLEQESLAKALGMSRDELAKSVLTQEAMNSLTDEQVAKARGVTLEQSKAMDVQAKMQLGLQKLAEAFAPVLEGIIPLVDVLLSIIKPIAKLVAIIAGNPIGKSILIAVVAVRLLGGGLFGAVQGMGSLAKGALDFVKNLNMAGVSKFFGGIKEKFGQGLVGKVQDKVSDKAGEVVSGVGDKVVGVADKTKNIKSGAGVKEFLTNLGKGLASLGKSLANGQVLLGLAALTLAVIGIGYALKLAAPGIQAFGTVVTAAFAGLATLVGAVADGFVKILGAVTMENIGPMLLLGPALFGIAAGLAAVSVAGLLALPAIGGLVALSLAAPALVSLGIGGESKSAGEAKGKSEESSMLKVLGEIRDAIQKGGDVYLDKDKVGRILDRQGVLTAVVGK